MHAFSRILLVAFPVLACILSGDYVFDGDMTETDYGVFVIGKKDNNILKIQFNGLLNSVLSKKNVQLNWFKKDDA
jgi:hypothetical protein